MRWITPSFIHVCYLCLMASVVGISYAAGNQREDGIRIHSEMREVGYSVGDVARQTIIVDVPKGYRFERGSLPTIGKTSDFVELSGARWEFKDSKNSTRYIFVLDWQIFQVLQEIKAYPLKPLNLQFRKDGKSLHAALAPGKVIVSSLLPTSLNAERLQPLPDVDAAYKPTMGLKSALFASLFLLLISMSYFAWYLDWLNIRSASSRPFRMASREIRAIRKNKGHDRIGLVASMKTLRRATDMTAGVALSSERLDLLFERNPWLVPMQSEMKRFYAESEELFFAGASNHTDLNQLYKLSLKLRALESRAG